MALAEIVGQSAAVGALSKNIANDQVAHAYLFHGPDGVGKRTAALAFARQLCCEKKNSCGQCPSCKRLASGLEHRNFSFVSDAGRMTIDDIRALIERTRIRHGGTTIWIMEKAERMRPVVANAFLKTLEEPRARIVFILLADNYNEMLPTIVSRCRLIPFFRLSDQLVAGILRQQIPAAVAEPDKLELVAKMAMGSAGRGLQLWQGEYFQRRKELVQLLASIPKASVPEVLGYSYTWSEDQAAVGEDLTIMLHWFRDLLVFDQAELGVPLFNQDQQQVLASMRAMYSQEHLVQIIQTIHQFSASLRGNARPRFLLGYLLLLIKRGIYV